MMCLKALYDLMEHDTKCWSASFDPHQNLGQRVSSRRFRTERSDPGFSSWLRLSVLDSDGLLHGLLAAFRRT